MKLTPDYIFEHLDEYYTNTYELNSGGYYSKRSTWNHIHGGWTVEKSHPIKKYVYAIMPCFMGDGKISCNKVVKGFITERYPSKDKENFIFTSTEITGEYNKFYGKSVPLIIPENKNLLHKQSDLLVNFAMFDNIEEAKEALNKCIKDNEKTTLENQLKTLDYEISNLKYELSCKLDKKENIIKKLNSL